MIFRRNFGETWPFLFSFLRLPRIAFDMTIVNPKPLRFENSAGRRIYPKDRQPIHAVEGVSSQSVSWKLALCRFRPFART